MDLRTYRRIGRLAERLSEDQLDNALANPVFIVSAPRSGSTLLFSMLATSPQTWTVGGESHGVFQQFPQLRAADETLSSGSLFAAHADAKTVAQMRRVFVTQLRDHAGRGLYQITGLRPDRPRPGVFLEKTPRNALNIPFLREVFPAARFIYLHRDPRPNIASIVEGWERGAQTGRFVTFRDLPDWPRGDWCFLLPPGWQALKAASLPQIAAFQWRESNEAILDGLADVPRARWTHLRYEDFIADPRAELEKLCAFCGIEMGAEMTALCADMPLSVSTVTPPGAEKWRRMEAELKALEPAFAPTEGRLRAQLYQTVKSI